MALNIGSKVYRNLQEQVAYNTEQIKKIFETLDGLNVQDNVIAIDSISDVLTQNEIDIASKAVAFIVYNGQLYIKKSGTVSSAVFDVVFSITQSTVITFNSSEITASLVDGSLSIVNSSVSTYSSTQIDTLLGAKASVSYVDTELAKKANLSGANFSGAITAPSIIENMSGYSYDVNTKSGSFTPTYIGSVKNGNKVTIVWAGTITPTDNTSCYLGRINVPTDKVGSKIFPIKNSIVSSQKATLNNIDTITSMVDANYYIEKGDISNNRTYLIPRVYLTNLTVGNTYIIRIEITFLLSDSLAA